jgi:protocatechuate 3,4-dioxygenase beta subunit
LPGIYPGRTRHIHVKVQAPNQSVLTTPLFFPDEPKNTQDGIFKSELLMKTRTSTEGTLLASFHFIV